MYTIKEIKDNDRIVILCPTKDIFDKVTEMFNLKWISVKYENHCELTYIRPSSTGSSGLSNLRDRDIRINITDIVECSKELNYNLF